MHRIEINQEYGLIEITVLGLWDEAHFAAFVQDLRAAIAGFPALRPPMSLYNYTGALIQTQAMVARMQALADHADWNGRKVALYSDGLLARQQARRIAGNRTNMRVFESRADALAFLLDDLPATAPARRSAAG